MRVILTLTAGAMAFLAVCLTIAAIVWKEAHSASVGVFVQNYQGLISGVLSALVASIAVIAAVTLGSKQISIAKSQAQIVETQRMQDVALSKLKLERALRPLLAVAFDVNSSTDRHPAFRNKDGSVQLEQDGYMYSTFSESPLFPIKRLGITTIFFALHFFPSLTAWSQSIDF